MADNTEELKELLEKIEGGDEPKDDAEFFAHNCFLYDTTMQLVAHEAQQVVFAGTFSLAEFEAAYEAAGQAALKLAEQLDEGMKQWTKLWAMRIRQFFNDHPEVHAFRFRMERDYDGFYSMACTDCPCIMMKYDTTLDDPPDWRVGRWGLRYYGHRTSNEDQKDMEHDKRVAAYGALYPLLEKFPNLFYTEMFGSNTMVTCTRDLVFAFDFDVIRYQDDDDYRPEVEYWRDKYALTDAMREDV
jgi:hypothetical protein